ncbi:MAG: endonuclease domain-containing protein [Chloroflexi bacterium]|nr:endonuclease domain-containing protein [Chloroflexota bacterium]
MRKDRAQTSVARSLRRHLTDAERVLWAQLSGRKLAGIKFRRQQPIGPYVVDFASLTHQLIVEVDGGHHDEPETRSADQQRTDLFNTRGYRVLRFWNSEVLGNLEGVVETIRRVALERSHPHPSPLPSMEREGSGSLYSENTR